MAIIGTCGGSASGKTSLSQLLAKKFPGQTLTIAQDNYYRDFGELTEQKKATINFDHPDSIENELLVRHLELLGKGLAVNFPIYDMITSRRVGYSEETSPKSLLLVEGLFLFCIPEIRRLIDFKVFIDADEETRCKRIWKRNLEERGHSKEYVTKVLDNYILPMHNEYVEPYKQDADLIVCNDDDMDLDYLDVVCDKIEAEIRARFMNDDRPPSIPLYQPPPQHYI